MGMMIKSQLIIFMDVRGGIRKQSAVKPEVVMVAREPDKKRGGNYQAG